MSRKRRSLAALQRRFAPAIRSAVSDILPALISTVLLTVLWQTQTLWPFTHLHPIL